MTSATQGTTANIQAPPEGPYLSFSKVAKRLGVTRASVHRWYQQKKLRGYRIGGVLRTTQADVDAWIASQNTDLATPPDSANTLAQTEKARLDQEAADVQRMLHTK